MVAENRIVLFPWDMQRERFADGSTQKSLTLKEVTPTFSA